MNCIRFLNWMVCATNRFLKMVRGTNLWKKFWFAPQIDFWKWFAARTCEKKLVCATNRFLKMVRGANLWKYFWFAPLTEFWKWFAARTCEIIFSLRREPRFAHGSRILVMSFKTVVNESNETSMIRSFRSLRIITQDEYNLAALPSYFDSYRLYLDPFNRLGFWNVPN